MDFAYRVVGKSFKLAILVHLRMRGLRKINAFLKRLFVKRQVLKKGLLFRSSDVEKCQRMCMGFLNIIFKY